MKHYGYLNILSLRPQLADDFVVGDHIIIQEKIDGANAAIRYDEDTDTIVAQSRKYVLDEENTLRGYYDWVKTLDKEKIKNTLGNNLVLFCEWLVPHSVKYPKDCYNKAYCYDVYDITTRKFLPQDKAKSIILGLELNYVPVFYDGDFISWEHCKSFVGRTEMGGEYGEGIVIKNQSKLSDPHKKQYFYTKIVDEKFLEVHKNTNQRTPEELEIINKSKWDKVYIKTILTDARIKKVLNKLVDDNILSENWSIKDMGKIAKILPQALYEDCLKEEPETVAKIDDFNTAAIKICMKVARETLEERDK